MKNLRICVVANIVLACVFTLLSVPVRADISVLAFVVSLLFTGALAWGTYWQLLRKDSIAHIQATRRFLEYEPFVYIMVFVLRRAGAKAAPFALDLVTALVWVLLLVLSLALLFMLGEKRVYSLSDAWKKEHARIPQKKYRGAAWVGIQALEWIDAIIQAAFTILLINLFIFQLYRIPSESMVPEFLVGDRVFVFKTLAGPKFPLSQVGLPYVRSYDRDDIVVFHNPHYANDRKSEVKAYFAQLVHMMTLTLVNVNVGENGEQMADPLVKRVVGLPGEQLMLMDGTLYARTADDAEFHVVQDDYDHAAWNLNELKPSVKAKVQWVPLTQAQYDTTLAVEAERRALDLRAASAECADIAAQFAGYAGGSQVADVGSVVSERERTVFSLFNGNTDLTVRLMSANGGAQWFEQFMTGWTAALEDGVAYTEQGSVTGRHLVGGDLYEDSCFRLDVMVKLAFGRLVLRNAQLLSGNADAAAWQSDEVRRQCLLAADDLYLYVQLMDQRNMGLFPPNDSAGNAQYIPEHSYFVMGDNRYNSLDMRHSYEKRTVALTAYDSCPVVYSSNLSPQSVSRDLILGKASFRFWPPSRIGVPGDTMRKSLR